MEAVPLFADRRFLSPQRTSPTSTSCLGLDDHIVSDSASRFYKLAFPRLYAEVYLPIGTGLKVEIGKWNALVGYQTGLGRNDFFYSKTFGYNITAATNTGVLVESELGEHWVTSHGINRGMSVWEDVVPRNGGLLACILLSGCG